MLHSFADKVEDTILWIYINVLCLYADFQVYWKSYWQFEIQNDKIIEHISPYVYHSLPESVQDLFQFNNGTYCRTIRKQ